MQRRALARRPSASTKSEARACRLVLALPCASDCPHRTRDLLGSPLRAFWRLVEAGGSRLEPSRRRWRGKLAATPEEHAG
jgi:hypothetical protein